MKMRSFVLLAMASAAMTAYGEPIDLGCSARGPLAALNNSVAFREAIGSANPANFLGSVYDVNGQLLSPLSAKSMHCPLFIDSNATPSASASNAILSAQAIVRAEKPAEQSATPVENKPIMVISAAGVVDQIPQPEQKNSETKQEPLAAPKAAASTIQNRRIVPAVSALGHENSQLQSEVSKPRQQLTVQAAVVPIPKLVEETRQQIIAAVGSEQNSVLSLAQAIRLVRQVQIRNSEAVLEFNPVMVLLDFSALFAAILAFCLMVFHPRSRVPAVDETTDPYHVTLRRIDSLERF